MYLYHFKVGIPILHLKLKKSQPFRYYWPFIVKMNYSEYKSAEIDLKEAHLKYTRQLKA